MSRRAVRRYFPPFSPAQAAVEVGSDGVSCNRCQGLVGTAVIEALARLGEVHGTDVDDMDVTDLEAVEAAFDARPPETVIHLAGLKGNLPSQRQPLKFFEVNTFGTLNLLEASRRHG